MTGDDPRFRDLDPTPDPLAPPIVAARSAFGRAITDFLQVPDAVLEREWPWTGGGETDIRSGFYIALERLEQAQGSIARTLAASGATPSHAAGALAANDEARWELHGALAPLPDALLDADPGGGEWTIRQTLAHLVGSQRGYPVFTAWWLGRREERELPPHAPDELEAELPQEAAEASGSLRQIRDRLDALVDLGTHAWQTATPDDLAVPARWSGFRVTVGFRVGRPSAHLQEHTVQVDKTLAMLGRAPTEVERLTRLLHRAYGGLEAQVWAMPSSVLDGPVASELTDSTAQVEAIASELRALA